MFNMRKTEYEIHVLKQRLDSLIKMINEYIYDDLPTRTKEERSRDFLFSSYILKEKTLKSKINELEEQLILLKDHIKKEVMQEFLNYIFLSNSIGSMPSGYDYKFTQFGNRIIEGEHISFLQLKEMWIYWEGKWVFYKDIDKKHFDGCENCKLFLDSIEVESDNGK